MREIGDKIKLNYKRKDHLMISDMEWDGYISGNIVFISPDNRYMFRDEFGYEKLIGEEEVK